jgi:hypothetical protein
VRNCAVHKDHKRGGATGSFKIERLFQAPEALGWVAWLKSPGRGWVDWPCFMGISFGISVDSRNLSCCSYRR